ncbi:hypothetical protein J6590_008941 [Homalodisca vitripennis]|nr:hypothetical protein J6590_008941 [Homalodisca vitripennis]
MNAVEILAAKVCWTTVGKSISNQLAFHDASLHVTETIHLLLLNNSALLIMRTAELFTRRYGYNAIWSRGRSVTGKRLITTYLSSVVRAANYENEEGSKIHDLPEFIILLVQKRYEYIRKSKHKFLTLRKVCSDISRQVVAVDWRWILLDVFQCRYDRILFTPTVKVRVVCTDALAHYRSAGRRAVRLVVVKLL